MQSDAGFRLAARVDETVIDLKALAEVGALPMVESEHGVLAQPDINGFIALGAARHREIYEALGELQQRDNGELAAHGLALNAAPMALPIAPGDFVDFYASRHHAARCAMLTRDPNVMPEAWDWMPLAYHGRTAGIMGSGAEFHRPSGWVKGKQGWALRKSRMLDFEMELGFVMRRSTIPGEQLSPADFEDAVFGCVLVTDWSARDLQGAEAKPLGPFHAKAFATQVGNWVVPLEVLAQGKVPAGDIRPEGRNPVEGDLYDIAFEARLQASEGEPVRAGAANFTAMGWTPAEMMAHLTLSGAPVRSGDLFASGTISGPGRDETGCLLERQAEGAGPLLVNGEDRFFLADGDKLSISAYINCSDRAIAFDTLDGMVAFVGKA
jgi:fumarylacetoacetase